MSEQWMRQCKLTVQVESEQPRALDLSDFHIYFRISQPTTEAPKSAEIYIYNLSKTTMDLLCGEDGQRKDSQVILEAGYKGSALETIFKGKVFQYRRGRDNQVDTWLCILAQSCDVAKSSAVINQTVPAGSSINDTKDALLKGYQDTGIQAGYTPDLSDQKLIRGRVLFGSLDRNTQQFCKDNDLAYSLADDDIHMRAVDKYTLEPVQILSAKTGVVGMPQLTSEGLKVTCLLNPKLKWGGRVQVDMTNMQTEAYDINYGGQMVDQPFKNQKLSTSANGMFIICSIERSGDNRGTNWYDDLVCIAVGAMVPKSGVSITGVAG